MNICLWNRDTQFSDTLQNMLRHYFSKNNLCVSLEHMQPEQGLPGAASGWIDLLFLDMHMSDLHSLEAISILKRISPDFALVLITDSAKDTAFCCADDAVILLEREITLQRLEACMERVMRRKNQKRERMELKFVNGSKLVYLDQISYVESQLHKAVFHFAGNQEQPRFLYETLDRLEESLAAQTMVRIHQSYLVNRSCIKKLERYAVHMSDGASLPVSKRRYALVREALQNA